MYTTTYIIGVLTRELQSGPGPCLGPAETGTGIGTKILFFIETGTRLKFPAGPDHHFLIKIPEFKKGIIGNYNRFPNF